MKSLRDENLPNDSTFVQTRLSKIFSILGDWFLVLYYLTDHPIYFLNLGTIKMRKANKTMLEWYNDFTWLLMNVFYILAAWVDS